MKIKLDKSQWAKIGVNGGWITKAEADIIDIYPDEIEGTINLDGDDLNDAPFDDGSLEERIELDGDDNEYLKGIREKLKDHFNELLKEMRDVRKDIKEIEKVLTDNGIDF